MDLLGRWRYLFVVALMAGSILTLSTNVGAAPQHHNNESSFTSDSHALKRLNVSHGLAYGYDPIVRQNMKIASARIDFLTAGLWYQNVPGTARQLTNR